MFFFCIFTRLQLLYVRCLAPRASRRNSQYCMFFRLYKGMRGYRQLAMRCCLCRPGSCFCVYVFYSLSSSFSLLIAQFYASATAPGVPHKTATALAVGYVFMLLMSFKTCHACYRVSRQFFFVCNLVGSFFSCCLAAAYPSRFFLPILERVLRCLQHPGGSRYTFLSQFFF